MLILHRSFATTQIRLSRSFCWRRGSSLHNFALPPIFNLFTLVAVSARQLRSSLGVGVPSDFRGLV